MANILEFLRGVLTDDDAQSAFRADPTGHLEGAGFGDLTGEDVVEAITVLRRSLPDDVAEALWPFEDEELLPAVRPGNDESELDAAVRVLAFAVEQVPTDGEHEQEPAPEPEAEAEPEPEPEPEHEEEPEPEHEEEPEAEEPGTEEEPEAEEEGEAEAEAEPEEEAEAEPEREAEGEREPVSSESSGAVGATLEPSAPVTVDVSTLPSVAALAESMAAVASDARDRFDEAIRQVVADAEVQAREVSTRYEELLRQAEADANDIRAASDEYAAERRSEADADRDAARQYLERTREESDDMLERSRQQLEDVRQQADDLLAASRAETDAARSEIEARQGEIRDAERQLKERLTGIDSLFRTVLRDDEATDE